MLPDAEPEQIKAALSKLDAELRRSAAWSNWESKGNHRFAIEANGRRYPVKQILSMASGQPVTSFSGGSQGANRVLESRGFTVVALREPPPENQQPMTRFREALQQILAGYKQATTEKFSGSQPIVQVFEEASRALAAIPAVVPRRIKVVPSAGKGNWPLSPGYRCSTPGRPTQRSGASTSFTSSAGT